MRMLLVSTYEMGRQPLHLASPAASLREAGHQVRTVDLAVARLDREDLAWADRVAMSVPMHTATRLADQVVAAIRSSRPELPIATYGLYAGVGSQPVELRLEGEYEPGLLAWADGGEGGESRHVGRSGFLVPDRRGLPGLGEYARLEHNGSTVLAGAVETSHGCRHRCRHCPIPVVYDGRIRVVPQEQVLADIENFVLSGAGHVTFGDADFLNAPAHSLAVIEEAHRRHPEVTFDATIKVEHILRHRRLWSRLAESKLLFVVSAFESVDPLTLEILDKGHTVADMAAAIEIVRQEDMQIRPTWLPFFPWTTVADVVDVFRFISDNGLGDATDPVQLSIRLLVPRGSLLEEHPALQPHLRGYDEAALTWRWDFADGETAVLHKELETIAANASDCGQEAVPTLDEMRVQVAASSGQDLPRIESGRPAPRLTESWFCCAEPTAGQMTAVTIGPRS